MVIDDVRPRWRSMMLIAALIVLIGCRASTETTIDVAQPGSPEVTTLAKPTAPAEPTPPPTVPSELTPPPTVPPTQPVPDAPALSVEPFDVVGLQPGRFEPGNNDVLIDSGSESTIVLDGQDPVWFGLLEGIPTFIDLGTVAPELIERNARGLSTLAACPDAIVVFVLRDPGELAAFDLTRAEVRWTVPADDPQIACGDAPIVAEQSDFALTGYDLTDGSVRWEVPLGPDDPLRTSSSQAIVGTYDNVRAIDLETGEQAWSVGDGDSAVAAVAPDFVVVDGVGPDRSFGIIDQTGTISQSIDLSEIDLDDVLVVRSPSGFDAALVDPDAINAALVDPDAIDLSDLDETAVGRVISVLGPAADGLLWASVIAEGPAVVAALVDADLQVVAISDAVVPDSLFLGFDSEVLTLPGVLVLYETGEAVIASR